MDLCKDCIHRDVCGKCTVTGGHIIKCVHYIPRSTQPDENGCIKVPRLPQLQDEIAVTLTREEWATVQAHVRFHVDHYKNQAYFWEHFCKDPQMAAESGKMYRGYAEGAAAILAKIEEAVDWTEPQKENEP